MSIKSISSLAKFLKWHEEQKQLLQKYNRLEHCYVPISFECFFRGMSKRCYDLIPSIYRTEELLENEDKIAADCLTQRPQDFRDDKSTIERLVRMQHYGIPTRLLDVTKSPLIALYFAVRDNPKNVGKVTAVFVAKRSIKYADSDTVSAVANIAHMPCRWSSCSSINPYYEYIIARDDVARQNYLTEYNKSPYIQMLHQQILREKPYFQPRLDRDDLERVWCVIPPLNNERIRYQQGAFLLFGIAGVKLDCIRIIEKERAELLLEATDTLEKLSFRFYPHGCSREEGLTIVQKSVRKFYGYFKENAKTTCWLENELNRILSSDDSRGEDILNACSGYFQKIMMERYSDIMRADASASGLTARTDCIDSIIYRFFYDFIYKHQAVFQTSVEVRNKKQIKQELEALGITDSYLFPGLSSIGREVSTRYSKKKTVIEKVEALS